MGTDITVLIFDWAHVEEAPPDQRLKLLEDAAAYPDDVLDLWYPERGWWPSVPETPWFAKNEFYRTLGTLKAHFWAGQAWEKIRNFADPGLRATLDGFLSALIWYGSDPDNEAVQVHVGLFPDDTRDLVRRDLVTLAYPPEAVPALVKLWVEAAPRFEELREPFATHAARPPGKMDGEFRGIRRPAQRLGRGGRRGRPARVGADRTAHVTHARRFPLPGTFFPTRPA